MRHLTSFEIQERISFALLLLMGLIIFGTTFHVVSSAGASLAAILGGILYVLVLSAHYSDEAIYRRMAERGILLRGRRTRYPRVTNLRDGREDF